MHRLAAVLRAAARDLRGHDVLLLCAGATFYAGIGLVPFLLVALGLAAALVGDAQIGRLAADAASALPDALGAPAAARRLVAAATAASPATLLLAVLPASLYGEGLRRVFVRLTGERDVLTGWRGRLRLLPLLAVSPLLALAGLLTAPTLATLLAGQHPSVGALVLGEWLALTVDWLLIWPALAYVFGVVGPRSPAWRPLLVGSGTTAAFLSGFLQGFVLFLALPLDLGGPFGGLAVIGAVVAVGFWLWLLHLVAVAGYTITLRLDADASETPPDTTPAPVRTITGT